MSEPSPYRRVLCSTVIVGGSSFVKILVGLVRLKAVALILGPSGLGLAGLFDSVLRTTSTVAGAGLSSSGVRQVAIASADPDAQTLVRRTIVVANLILGSVGGLSLWLFRVPVANYVFEDSSRAGSVGWLGLGVFLTLAAASQTTLLQGLRRIGDLAKVSIAGSTLGAVGGVMAIWYWGESGVIAFILVAPGGALVMALYYGLRLQTSRRPRTPLADIATQWKKMASLGLVFMLSTLLMDGTQLFVRSLIGKTISLSATGHFQAAWAISMQYIGFVLAAMATDYYPRLSAAIANKTSSNEIVNQQIRISLLLAGPVMLAMLTLTPWVVELFYTKSFLDSVEILRWQILGDVMKVATWPMGFILIAKAENRAFLFTQIIWSAGYTLLVWMGLPILGLPITGIAFLASYLLGFIVNSIFTSKLTGFRYTRENMRVLVYLLSGAATIVAISKTRTEYTFFLGAPITIAFSLYAVTELLRLGNLGVGSPHIIKWLAAARQRWRRP